MRLQEPLNGIKIGVGHNLIHLAFIITMLTVNTDIELNLHYSGTKEPYPAAVEEAHRLLAAAAAASTDDEKPDPISIKKHELFIFYDLLVSHICCFIFQLLILLLKKLKWNNTAQVLANIMLMNYMFLMSYTAYETKLNMHFWDVDVNYVRMWLYIETIFWIMWVLGSVIFMEFAFWFKIKSSIKNDEMLENDDNIWNDRKTDDFLRYIKFDYYVFTLNITCFLMNIYVMYTPFGTIPKMGLRSLWPTGTIIIITIVQRGLQLIH